MIGLNTLITTVGHPEAKMSFSRKMTPEKAVELHHSKMGDIIINSRTACIRR